MTIIISFLGSLSISFVLAQTLLNISVSVAEKDKGIKKSNIVFSITALLLNIILVILALFPNSFTIIIIVGFLALFFLIISSGFHLIFFEDGFWAILFFVFLPLILTIIIFIFATLF